MVVAVSAAGRVIALWSHPRALSTALLRVMMERGDLHAVYEPFSNLEAVGSFEIGEHVARSHDELVDAIFAQARQGPVFLKDTTEYRHAPRLADRRMLHEVVHTFIVRDPEQAIPSHHAVNPDVTCAEIGYEHLHEIFAAVQQATGAPPTVIDAEDLQQRPEATVRAYCAAVGLPFLPHALSWRAEPREEWRRTEHWHRDVNDSTGIRPRPKRYAVRVDNDERLASFDRYHRPFYAELRRHRLVLPAPTAGEESADDHVATA